MATSEQTALKLQQIFEASSHELRNHIRVSVHPRNKTLIYHIEPGIELKINIEIGRVFLTDASKIKERIERIVTHACMFKRGSRIADAVHHFVEEDDEE